MELFPFTTCIKAFICVSTQLYLPDLPFPLGRDDVVSLVLCCIYADATQAGVVGATEELQTSQVKGAQRQIGGTFTWASQSIPVGTLE